MAELDPYTLIVEKRGKKEKVNVEVSDKDRTNWHVKWGFENWHFKTKESVINHFKRLGYKVE